jgi:hypothetical protein
MVAIPLDIARDTYMVRVLDALYGAVLGLDVQGYRWVDSDGWSRARVPLEWTAHLEAWVDLGTSGSLTRTHWVHQCALVYGCRYVADDDGLSQARVHASIRAATLALLRTPIVDGRVTATGTWELTQDDPGWVTVAIPFTLHLPTGA